MTGAPADRRSLFISEKRRSGACYQNREVNPGAVAPILLLRGYGNILVIRSVTGRTMKWAQAHFFVAAGWTELQTGLGRGVFR